MDVEWAELAGPAQEAEALAARVAAAKAVLEAKDELETEVDEVEVEAARVGSPPRCSATGCLRHHAAGQCNCCSARDLHAHCINACLCWVMAAGAHFARLARATACRGVRERRHAG